MDGLCVIILSRMASRFFLKDQEYPLPSVCFGQRVGLARYWQALDSTPLDEIQSEMIKTTQRNRPTNFLNAQIHATAP
jgi:hypothetical protein